MASTAVIVELLALMCCTSQSAAANAFTFYFWAVHCIYEAKQLGPSPGLHTMRSFNGAVAFLSPSRWPLCAS
jgi:hypothetical protein